MKIQATWAVAALGCLLTASLPAASDPAELVRVRNMFDGWKAPVPPRHLVDNLYYVGAIGVSSFLITTPEGHILIDTGFDDTVPIIERGVTELGFKLTDIKLILSSHAHVDHVGGHARLKQLTGAQVIASAADARTLESGGADDFIPLPRELILYAPVHVDRIVSDGERIELGGVALTANLTPGHTRGATTWTMDVHEGGQTYRVVFFSSASVNAGTRLRGDPRYPDLADDLARSLQRLKGMPCDIFLAPHGGQFAMAEKFARLDKGEGIGALVDRAGWARVLAAMEQGFRDALAREAAAGH